MIIGILGFGLEGQSVFKFLKKEDVLKNNEVWILDKNPKIKVPLGCKSLLGKKYISPLKKFSLVFRTPGIPYNLPELVSARRAGVRFSSLTKLFFDRCPGRIIGITGTKGKGTTSTLLFNILKTAHKPVFLAGNIGRAALDILPAIKKDSLVVLELSSFQLQDLEKSPCIAVILDMFPDHQNAHRDLKEYYEAKANIARFQKRSDTVFFFSRNKMSRWAAQKGHGRKIAVDETQFKVFGPDDLKIRGYHNFKNAVMAANIAAFLGIPKKTITETVKKFRGMEHRLEFVAKKGGISFYNDSASTNPQTAAAAVLSFSKSSVLIAGGQDKGLDYKPLSEALKKSTAKAVILVGENKKKIFAAIKNSGVPTEPAKDLKSAVRLSIRRARENRFSRGESIIIFSPGATSFDMFRNYADRGEKFKKIIRDLD